MIKNIPGKAAMRLLVTKPTMIITTLHPSGVVNAGVFGAWTNLSGEHVGAAIHTGSHTYANILRGKEFVVNIPGADIVKSLAVIADDIPPERSEVLEAGLTLRDGMALATPSIAECAAAVEFTFDREIEIGGHALLIGKAAGGWARADCLDPDGRLNIFKARVMKDFKYPQPLYVLPGEVIEG